MGVVNRDIKLENTLLDGGKRPLLKICDFGYSKNEKDSLPKSKVGTPGYTGTSSLLAHEEFVVYCRENALLPTSSSKQLLPVLAWGTYLASFA